LFVCWVTTPDVSNIVPTARQRVITYRTVALDAARPKEAVVALTALDLVEVPDVIVCVDRTLTRVLTRSVIADIAAVSVAIAILGTVHYGKKV
jgi:hypothetical protein